MRTGLIAKKVGMTRVFDNNRKHNSVTVLEIPSAKVLKLRKVEKDGYNALVIGFDKISSSKLNKPEKSFFAKLKTEPARKIKEFRVTEDSLVESGTKIDVSHFVVGQFVDVKATSIGKGFAGGMKRHNFSGLRASHGVSISHRSHGSTGNSQDPGKVWKGKKMAGQLGNKTVSIQNLEVVSIDEERGLEWYPSVINMGPMGMIYPEGTPENWVYKVAKVVAIPEEDRKNYPKEEGGYYETFLDVENALEYPSNKFLNACKSLGIAADV